MIKIGKNISEFSAYSCQPKTKKELEQIVENRINKEGLNCDLNDIDVSLITDMSYLFYMSKFNGDISKWDVSNVINMEFMFGYTNFNGDISNWDMSKVKYMSHMFERSNFNQDISNWNMRKDCITCYMFAGCPIKDEFKPKLPK